MRIKVFPTGITGENVTAFTQGAAIAINETAYSLPSASCWRGHPGGAHTDGHRRQLRSWSQRICLASGGALDDGEKGRMAQVRALCPRVPDYVHWDVLMGVMKGQRPVVSVSQAVVAVAAVISHEAVARICGLRELVWLLCEPPTLPSEHARSCAAVEQCWPACRRVPASSWGPQCIRGGPAIRDTGSARCIADSAPSVACAA
jgi:hypothetical protein